MEGAFLEFGSNLRVTVHAITIPFSLAALVVGIPSPDSTSMTGGAERLAHAMR